MVSSHAFCLLMEMFVVHVALTMSTDSCFVFVLIDCFKELTMQVFKKADNQFLFTCALDDSVERFQMYFYIFATLLQTRQDFYITIRHVAILMTGECLVDYLKHYFLVRLNKLNANFYLCAQESLFRSYLLFHQVKSLPQGQSSDEQIQQSQALIRRDLMPLDADTQLALVHRFVVLPQICLFLRFGSVNWLPILVIVFAVRLIIVRLMQWRV